MPILRLDIKQMRAMRLICMHVQCIRIAYMPSLSKVTGVVHLSAYITRPRRETGIRKQLILRRQTHAHNTHRNFWASKIRQSGIYLTRIFGEVILRLGFFMFCVGNLSIRRNPAIIRKLAQSDIIRRRRLFRRAGKL